MRKNQQNAAVFLFLFYSPDLLLSSKAAGYWNYIYMTHQTTINSNDLIFILNLSNAVFISQYPVMQPLSNYINLFFASLSIKGDMTD